MEKYGKIWDNPSKTMEKYGTTLAKPWKNMEKYGKTLAKPMEKYGKIWDNPSKTMEKYGTTLAKPWKNMEKYGKTLAKPMEKYGKIHSQWMYSKWCVNRKTSKEKVDCPAMFDEQRVKLIFTHSEMEVTLRIPWLILENLQKIRLRLGSLYRIPRFIIYIYIYTFIATYWTRVHTSNDPSFRW